MSLFFHDVHDVLTPLLHASDNTALFKRGQNHAGHRLKHVKCLIDLPLRARTTILGDERQYLRFVVVFLVWWSSSPVSVVESSSSLSVKALAGTNEDTSRKSGASNIIRKRVVLFISITDTPTTQFHIMKMKQGL